MKTINQPTAADSSAPPEPAPNPGVLLRRSHNITAFCSSDESRYVITGVHYNADKKRLEATDGRILALVPVNGSVSIEDFPPTNTAVKDDLKDCIVPKKAFSEAFASIPKNMTLPILESLAFSGAEVNGQYRVSMTATDLDADKSQVSKCIEGNFPNVERAIPTKEAAKFTIRFGAGLLQKICAYFAENCPLGKDAMTLEFGGSNTDPVVITGQTRDELTAKFVLMPVRME